VFKIALPILYVSSSVAAERFYCDKLGFHVIYAYRPDPARSDPCWLGVLRDGAHIVLSSFEANGPPGRVVQIYVEDVAAIHREYRAAGVPVPDEILDQDWGNLEFSFVDPDGNRIEIAQDKGN
jgi:catechol 2,3-dioxygenase-like lactoylglutathione lyase family enzyme